MKEEIKTVLDYLECEGEIFLLRNQLLALSVFQPVELQQTITRLQDAINHTNIQNHKHAGFYYLFLGSAYFEQDHYENAVPNLQSAVNEMWGAQINRALARWLLGLCYFNMQEFPNARNELQEALQLLSTHRGVNSPRSEREHRSRQIIRQNIKDAYEQLLNESLFRNVQADPVQNVNRFPLQDPPKDEDKNALIPQNMSISVTNENFPSINIPVTINNENQPVNKLSFTPTSPDLPTKAVKKEEPKTTEKDNETRTDDDGYLVIRSIPVYDEYVRAGQSDEPAPVISRDLFAEFHQVSINNKLHTIHSLKSNTKQVSVNKEGDWGWIKVKGNSMNAMKGRVSIDNGDYILFQHNPNASDNDIVIAINKDAATNESSAHVKRLRASRTMLYSETTEKGAEYEPIDIKKNSMKIAGIVYAVAKPIIP